MAVAALPGEAGGLNRPTGTAQPAPPTPYSLKHVCHYTFAAQTRLAPAQPAAPGARLLPRRRRLAAAAAGEQPPAVGRRHSPTAPGLSARAPGRAGHQRMPASADRLARGRAGGAPCCAAGARPSGRSRGLRQGASTKGAGCEGRVGKQPMCAVDDKKGFQGPLMRPGAVRCPKRTSPEVSGGLSPQVPSVQGNRSSTQLCWGVPPERAWHPTQHQWQPSACPYPPQSCSAYSPMTNVLSGCGGGSCR
jgi:hypothetical protein